MTDDDLTELECVIVDYCEEAVRRGWRIGLIGGTNGLCPLFAVAVVRNGGFLCSSMTSAGLNALGLSDDAHCSELWRGFDGCHQPSDHPLYAMGVRLRERAERGEFGS